MAECSSEEKWESAGKGCAAGAFITARTLNLGAIAAGCAVGGALDYFTCEAPEVGMAKEAEDMTKEKQDPGTAPRVDPDFQMENGLETPAPLATYQSLPAGQNKVDGVLI